MSGPLRPMWSYRIMSTAKRNASARTPVLRDLAIEICPTGSLTPSKQNARTHSEKQTQQIAASVSEFSFTNPILADEAGEILAGHGRLAAAKALGLTSVPV